MAGTSDDYRTADDEEKDFNDDNDDDDKDDVDELMTRTNASDNRALCLYIRHANSNCRKKKEKQPRSSNESGFFWD